MTRYVALLRGINVGGKHILPMQKLRDILASLGCEDVATYIQSGNAVFCFKFRAGYLFGERLENGRFARLGKADYS